jgi:hypothetical protein
MTVHGAITDRIGRPGIGLVTRSEREPGTAVTAVDHTLIGQHGNDDDTRHDSPPRQTTAVAVLGRTPPSVLTRVWL